MRDERGAYMERGVGPEGAGLACEEQLDVLRERVQQLIQLQFAQLPRVLQTYT